MLQRIKAFMKRLFPLPAKSALREFGKIQRRFRKSDRDIQALRRKVDAENRKLKEIKRAQQKTVPQPFLTRFEYDIVDHCNLNCKHCAHFSPLAEKRFVDLEDIRRDLERMSVLTNQNLVWLTFEGGEALLHPQLKEVMRTARRIFPNSFTHIQLLSNGILLLKQDNDFWETCRDCAIEISVTKYPINLDYERIEQTAQERGVYYEFFGATTRDKDRVFFKPEMDIRGLQNPIQSFLNCPWSNLCTTLIEGKLYICPFVANVHHFNRKFGTDMQLLEGDYLDIYKVEDIREILNFISSPRPFCRYCKTAKWTGGHPWEVSKREMEEWV